MATPSDAAAAFSFGFLPSVMEKLTRGNYTMWKAQVVATLQGAQLWSFTKPTSQPPPEFLADDAGSTAAGKKAAPVPNLDHEKWFAKDSQVRSYLFSSFSKDVFSQVADKTTAAELWAAIQNL